MQTRRFSIVPFAGQNRAEFDCGSPDLNRYLQQQAGQDMKRNVAACLVAVEDADASVAGFYTLSACHLALDRVAPDLQRRLSCYPNVPAVRLGRLAVDSASQGHKLGAVLLADAVLRALRSEIAAALMVVDAKDAKAATFYEYHGFLPDPGTPMQLYVSLAGIARRWGLV
jgi:GNAT superfamily N-acetyltransferase